MDIRQALLDSWDRQCRILDATASRINESNRHLKPSEDGWPLDLQLAHIHGVRRFWLSHVDPARAAALSSSYKDDENALEDLDAIKANLRQSAKAVRDAVDEHLQKGTQQIVTENCTYDHPVTFLQHMVWHEGWHVGLIFLALRLAGQEAPEEWEEANIWSQWREERW